MARRRIYVFAVLAVMSFAMVSAQATSHVRIVRLSYEDGSVQMDRTTGQGLERAILNSPIVEGSSVVTGTDGLAEVEFENNSTVRLGQSTDVKFRQLLINDADEMINEVELVRGTMYFDTRSGKNNVYRVIAADRSFIVQRNAQVRFLMSGDQVQVAVLNGEAQLENSTEAIKIKKNDTLTVDATVPAGFVVAKGLDTLPLDHWNSERAAYQTVYAYNNAGSYGGPKMAGFGYSDLAYYGGFFNAPGYGLAWQPYGASSWMGWDPYMAGAWTFAPGMGYAWASAYPWGWLPFHYGSWAFASGMGWFWVPGNSFHNGWANTNWRPSPTVVNGPAGYTAPTPPATTANGPRPSVLVGRIGRTPAYIPGGPIPPNFRSAIDRSSIVGMTAPMTGSTGAGSSAARNSRAINMNGSNSATGNNRSGHVFAVPPPTPVATSPSFSGPMSPSMGRSAASPAGPGVGLHSTEGMGHASSSSSGRATHSAGGAKPK